MLKSYQLAIGLSWVGILAAPAIALAGPTLISRKGVALPPADVPLCYLTTAGGQVLNLGGLCDRTGTTPTTASVVVTDLKFAGNSVTGRVKNNTNQVVTAVVINYAIASADADQQDTGSVLLEQSTLKPQQEGTFRADLPKSSQLKVTSVDWVPAN